LIFTIPLAKYACQAARPAAKDISVAKWFVDDPAVNAMLRDYDLPESLRKRCKDSMIHSRLGS
jgi:hypothetical protein